MCTTLQCCNNAAACVYYFRSRSRYREPKRHYASADEMTASIPRRRHFGTGGDRFLVRFTDDLANGRMPPPSLFREKNPGWVGLSACGAPSRDENRKYAENTRAERGRPAGPAFGRSFGCLMRVYGHRLTTGTNVCVVCVPFTAVGRHENSTSRAITDCSMQAVWGKQLSPTLSRSL